MHKRYFSGLPRLSHCEIASLGPGWISLECHLLQGGADADGEVSEEMLDGEDKLKRKLPRIRVLAFRLLPSGETDGSVAVLNSTFVLENFRRSRTLASVLVRGPGLASGSAYVLRVTPVSPAGVEGATLEEELTTGMALPAREEEEEKEELTVVSVEASTSSSPTLIPADKDPIRLLPVIGALTLIVTLLVLVAVIIVVVMRTRDGGPDDVGDKVHPGAHLKTHVGFNQSLDVDIDKKGRGGEDPQIDKGKIS